jgi:hypothetical protein
MDFQISVPSSIHVLLSMSYQIFGVTGCRKRVICHDLPVISFRYMQERLVELLRVDVSSGARLDFNMSQKPDIEGAILRSCPF